MEKTDEIIYYNSDRAAQPCELVLQDGTKIPLWRSAKGNAYKDEHMARYDGCTHRQCECGQWHKKTWTICDSCRAKKARERYLALPAKEYDESPVAFIDDDTYFWSIDDIIDYCDENDVKKEDLNLVFCDPVKLTEVEYDQWEDLLPYDSEGEEFSQELHDALKNLNEVIKNHKPVAWMAGKVRVVFGKEYSDV